MKLYWHEESKTLAKLLTKWAYGQLWVILRNRKLDYELELMCAADETDDVDYFLERRGWKALGEI